MKHKSPQTSFSLLCHRVLSLCYLPEPLPLLMLGMGWLKSSFGLVQKSLNELFGSTQYMACGPHLPSQEHSVRDLIGPGLPSLSWHLICSL